MNKKFSTLMASVLLASAFSTAAYAAVTAGVDKDLKGKSVALWDASGSTNVLSVNANNELVKVAATSAFSGTFTAAGSGVENSFAVANRALWKVASVKFDQTTGVPTYQFVNKKTGAYLAINLETDKNGSSVNPVKLNGAGNKNWSLNDGVLYAYANDSIYTLEPGAAPNADKFYLKAVKGATLPDAGLKIGTDQTTIEAKAVTLTAAGWNEMMASLSSDGKLKFNNSKDVSTGEDNLLTKNKYVAYTSSGAAGTSFFLAQKDKKTSVNKNPYVLVVSKDQHAPALNSFFKFDVDTLAISATDAAKMTSEAGFTSAPTLEWKQGAYNHPVKAATFSASYYFANDSIALRVAGVPTAYVANNFAVTDGTDAWSGLGVNNTASGGGSTNGQNADSDKVDLVTVVKSLGNNPDGSIANLLNAVKAWIGVAVSQDKKDDEATSGYALKFSESKLKFSSSAWSVASDGNLVTSNENNKEGVLYLAEKYLEENADATDAEKAFVKAVKTLARKTVTDAQVGTYFVKGLPTPTAGATANVPVITQLSNTKVLTVAASAVNYIKPLIQPFTTTGGDAEIAAGAKLYTLQVKNTANDVALRATAQNDKYLVSYKNDKAEIAETADAANVYAQWAFVSGETGYYQIINRGSKHELYSGPVAKVKDAAGNVVADTYVLGADTVKLAAVTLSTNEFEDKEGDKTVKYDYSGYFYAGPTKDKSYSFAIAPVAAIMTEMGAQFNKDSVMVLGKAEDAPVWYFQEAGAVKYGLEIEGLTPLKYMKYKIFTKNANGDSLYVYAKNNKYSVTNKGAEPVTFVLREINKGQYLFLEADGANKITINPTPAQPVLEQSAVATMRDDYFTIASASSNAYRTLTEEDGVNGNVKIFMNNEPYRYLYENTANIVANNGNAIAKDSLNFLGIFNAAASSKNAALYVDTAYVNRKGVTMPQYMFALGVEDHEATPAAPCTKDGVHVDKDGKPTTADKCVHATPATKAYKSGRYLVSVADSASTAKHPAKYDGAFRLAFVEAIHVEGSDSLIIVNSKYTNNTNAIESGKATTYASKDTLKFENDKPNVATFALLIKDQADKSFYLETANKTYVRILNGVPVLTDNIENAAIFNIEATTEEATANEAIEAAGVQVIGGKGAVTVQGAAGKVITVANVLGQTIANQVAASDNVTIAAPAGVIVVAVEGEATKVVVK